MRINRAGVIEMSLIGVALTAENKKLGSLYVEWHRCDKCGAEYRVYFASEQQVEEAFQRIAKMLKNKADEQDLCFDCQNQVIGNQVMMPMRV